MTKAERFHLRLGLALDWLGGFSLCAVLHWIIG